MNLDSYYENRRKTDEEQDAWDSFHAAHDLAKEHFGKKIKRIEMSRSARDMIFGGSCDEIWDADVIVNDALLDKNVIFEVEDDLNYDAMD